MTSQDLRLPADIRALLRRKFRVGQRAWLSEVPAQGAATWPLEVRLGAPTELGAARQPQRVRDWITAWQACNAPGVVTWADRQWRVLGTQRIPVSLRLQGADEVAEWAGEGARWSRAVARYRQLVQCWPAMAAVLAACFDVLADYADVDFARLQAVLDWICTHPDSGLYLRQMPVQGVDTKWVEGRRKLIVDLVASVRALPSGEQEFYAVCGFRPVPHVMRLRLLDARLGMPVSGLTDISAPWPELAQLPIMPRTVFIVENLQTGLAFGAMEGAVVIMGLGYAVDVLDRIPWLQRARRCLYWGDIDTHGFAILNRARGRLPALASFLMDKETLFAHRDLWVAEPAQHGARDLPLLTSAEREVFQALRANRWGQQVRLEQERVRWDRAWQVIQAMRG